MSEDCTPYIEQNPGDLITAENWNRLQCLIQDDIRTTAQEAVDAIESVPHADNSDKLEGKSADELTADIVKRALAEIRLHSGYLAAFKILKVGEDKGDFDDLCLTAQPRKTINLAGARLVSNENAALQGPPAPTQVQVSQYDLDTVGLRLLADPIYPQDQLVREEAPGTLVEQFGKHQVDVQRFRNG